MYIHVYLSVLDLLRYEMHYITDWAHGNLDNSYLSLSQKDQALHHLQMALNCTLEHERTPRAIGRAYNNLGTTHQSLNELDKAREYFDLAFTQALLGRPVSMATLATC